MFECYEQFMPVKKNTSPSVCPLAAVVTGPWTHAMVAHVVALHTGCDPPRVHLHFRSVQRKSKPYALDKACCHDNGSFPSLLQQGLTAWHRASFLCHWYQAGFVHDSRGSLAQNEACMESLAMSLHKLSWVHSVPAIFVGPTLMQCHFDFKQKMGGIFVADSDVLHQGERFLFLWSENSLFLPFFPHRLLKNSLKNSFCSW